MSAFRKVFLKAFHIPKSSEKCLLIKIKTDYFTSICQKTYWLVRYERLNLCRLRGSHKFTKASATVPIRMTQQFYDIKSYIFSILGTIYPMEDINFITILNCTTSTYHLRHKNKICVK